jgi:hypothetical protein
MMSDYDKLLARYKASDLARFDYDQYKEIAKRWGKLNGFTGSPGGWIYNADFKPVCQGWGEFFEKVKLQILRDVEAGTFALGRKADAAIQARKAREAAQLKARVDANEVITVRTKNGAHCMLSLNDRTYLMQSGTTGAHRMNVCTSDAERLKAHWDGFLLNNGGEV